MQKNYPPENKQTNKLTQTGSSVETTGVGEAGRGLQGSGGQATRCPWPARLLAARGPGNLAGVYPVSMGGESCLEHSYG